MRESVAALNSLSGANAKLGVTLADPLEALPLAIQESALRRIRRRVSAWGNYPRTPPREAFHELLRAKDTYSLEPHNVVPLELEKLKLLGERGSDEIEAMAQAGDIIPVQPYEDENLRRDPVLKLRLYRSLISNGIGGARRGIRSRMALFSVREKDGSQRMIVGAREANQMMRPPPCSVRGGPGAIASMDLSPEALAGAGGGIQAADVHLTLPAEVRWNLRYIKSARNSTDFDSLRKPWRAAPWRGDRREGRPGSVRARPGVRMRQDRRPARRLRRCQWLDWSVANRASRLSGASPLQRSASSLWRLPVWCAGVVRRKVSLNFCCGRLAAPRRPALRHSDSPEPRPPRSGHSDLVCRWNRERKSWYVFIATPCTAWSRGGWHRPPASSDEARVARRLVRFIVRMIKLCESALRRILPPRICGACPRYIGSPASSLWSQSASTAALTGAAI